jgi:hypothetical protein
MQRARFSQHKPPGRNLGEQHILSSKLVTVYTLRDREGERGDNYQDSATSVFPKHKALHTKLQVEESWENTNNNKTSCGSVHFTITKNLFFKNEMPTCVQKSVPLAAGPSGMCSGGRGRRIMSSRPVSKTKQKSVSLALWLPL